MPSLFKRGDRYYVAFYSSKKSPPRKQVSLRVSGYKAAKAKSASLIAQYEGGSYCPWAPSVEVSPVSLQGAAKEFLQSRSNLSPQSIQKYHSVLGQFVRFVGSDVQVRDCTGTIVQSFIDSGNRKPITKKTYSTTLSPFFNWCIGIGMMRTNPISSIRLPSVQKGLPKTLSEEEVSCLLKTIGSYDQDSNRFPDGTVLWMQRAVQVALVLGLRVSELCQLKWEDIDYKNRTIRVGGRAGFKTKNSKTRLLPLTKNLMDVLSTSKTTSAFVISSSTGKGLSGHYLSTRFKYFCRLADLPRHISFHSLRHTTCTRLIQSGASLEVARRFMGHSSVSVTQRYIHICDEQFFRAIEHAESNESN